MTSDRRTASGVARALTLLVSLVVALAASELAFRLIDGWPLWGALPLAERTVDVSTFANDRPDRRYADRVRLAAGIRKDWYEQDPPPIPRRPMSPEFEARARRYPAEPYNAFTVWNREFLQPVVCAGVTEYGLGVLDDVFVFDSPEPGQYPIYRNVPNSSPPGSFVANRYGWRGTDFELNKDGRTVRVAFVGASTTTGKYSLPYSYPEFVGHWLALWLQASHPGVRIEIMNAARTGIDSNSIAAIVRQEVAPLEPDLVVYYEGANGFSPRLTLHVPTGAAPPPLKYTFAPPGALERLSALARRFSTLTARVLATDGREPRKPSYPLDWPKDVDEQRPDPDATSLPLQLPTVIHNLDVVRDATRKAGGRLAVGSFMWLVPDPDRRLDFPRHLAIYQYLNTNLWPASYAHIRRMADFQNRVFRAYADTRGDVAYLEIAGALPQDPDLFDDPIHMGEPGLRLQGWIVLQQLVPWLERRLASGELPRPMRTMLDHHPAIGSTPPELMSLKALKARCRVPSS